MSETVAQSTTASTPPPPTTTDSSITQKPTPESTQNKIKPHRTLLFYIHRPRTATKLPVLCPVSSETTITEALRNRTVLEFPTIYAIPTPLTENQSGGSNFILEKEYLRTNPDTGAEADGEEGLEEAEAQPVFGGAGAGAVDAKIADMDEGKVLEVLEKDLLAVPEAEAEAL
jgi:hypothetical protein